MIATPSHKAGILEQLTGAACNPEKRMEQGDLVMLDAAELLSVFMVGGMPGVGSFESAMTRVMNSLADRGSQRGVRVYGEMVDLLWKSKKEDAALSLETRWDQFVEGAPVSAPLQLLDGVPGRARTQNHLRPPQPRHVGREPDSPLLTPAPAGIIRRPSRSQRARESHALTRISFRRGALVAAPIEHRGHQGHKRKCTCSYLRVLSVLCVDSTLLHGIGRRYNAQSGSMKHNTSSAH